MSLEELKSKVEAARSVRVEGKKVRWPDDVRLLLVELIKNGVPEKEISKATGIAHQTFRNWVKPKKVKRKKKLKPISFEEVTIQSAPDQSILLRWASGFEISGLNFENIITLLQKGLL